MSEKVGEAGDAASKPTALLVMGMAGSGKTTFVQRLTAELQMANLARVGILSFQIFLLWVLFP